MIAPEGSRNNRKASRADFAGQIHCNLALEGKMLTACTASELVRLDPQCTGNLLDQQFAPLRV